MVETKTFSRSEEQGCHEITKILTFDQNRSLSAKSCRKCTCARPRNADQTK